MSRSARRSGTGERRSHCPVACALDVVGDRWTLLVIRDLLNGKKRYGEFLASPERIPTNILADRLKRLEANGLVVSVRYSERPPRAEYHLTEAGRGLRPAILALVAWGLEQFPGTSVPRRPRPPAADDPAASAVSQPERPSADAGIP